MACTAGSAAERFLSRLRFGGHSGYPNVMGQSSYLPPASVPTLIAAPIVCISFLCMICNRIMMTFMYTCIKTTKEAETHELG